MNIYVANDGGLIMFSYPKAWIGKVADTFDSYPYTIKLIVTNVDANSADGGTITFYSATNLDCYYNLDGVENKQTYHKFSDKLIAWDDKEYSKERLCSWVNW